MGLGDVKLAAVAGVWLDWAFLPLVVEIAALSGLAAALYARLRGDGLDLKGRLPFGAFFAPAIWICCAHCVAQRLGSAIGQRSQYPAASDAGPPPAIGAQADARRSASASWLSVSFWATASRTRAK